VAVIVVDVAVVLAVEVVVAVAVAAGQGPGAEALELASLGVFAVVHVLAESVEFAPSPARTSAAMVPAVALEAPQRAL
jgi:hypothetical protein